MDIEKLKKEHMENKNVKEELQKDKDSTMRLFTKLTNIESAIRQQCKIKLLGRKLNIEKEFEEYFKDGGFTINSVSGISANYNGLEVTLLSIEHKDDESKYVLKIDNDKYHYFKLTLENKYRNMLDWCYPLSSNSSFNIDSENGRVSIYSCHDIYKLKNASSFLEEKIEEFDSMLKGIDSLKYVYIPYEKDEIDRYDKAEYDTFEELIKAL